MALILPILSAHPTAQAQNAPIPLQVVTVIATLPIPGVNQPLPEIASAVQTATAAQIDAAQVLDLSDFMNQRLGGVHVNNTQGNPFQMDVSYRGFTASPLLGTPQGLSVYMDGMRMNQPFGDVVSWDLMPRSAISSITLMPGSNPLFGLNTLGGAISMQTKSGLTHAGTSVTGTVGQYGRRSAEFEHGGRNMQGLHWFVTANTYDEAGWRDASPSQVRQLFGKLGYKSGSTDIALSISLADNTLTGNGLQEFRMLASDRRSIYTRPDETNNRATQINLTAKHALSDELIFSGNAYARSLHTRSVNGDVNDGALDQAVYQLSAADRTALNNAGYTGFPTSISGANASNTPFPMWRCIAQALQNDEPGEKCTGLINRTSTAQSNHGVSGQWTWLAPLAGQRNQLTAGLAYDSNRTRFEQSSELGYLNPDRSVTGIKAYADGVTGGSIDGTPYDNRVDLRGQATTHSLFMTDTLSLADRFHLTLSARYNRTHIRNSDQITPGGGPGSLDGNHVFSRLNPALGLAFALTPEVSAYAGYNEGSRTPTATELGCADPATPCKLPNAMAGDPPLRQVVTKTWEAGWRAKTSPSTQWTAGVFRAESTDDILFVASDMQNGFGYFRNFGKTLRQGLELGVQSRQNAWTLGGHYTWLQATYQTPETLGGSANSSNDAIAPGLDGHITVRPGDAIPLIPRHILKLNADVQLNPAWRVGASLVATSGMYARGNENNQHQSDGVNYLGSGRTAGYAVVNLNARYQPTPNTTWTLNIANLFNTAYATAAQMGPTAFSANGQQFVTRPYAAVGGEYPLQNSMFMAPGAPRTLWLSLRQRFN